MKIQLGTALIAGAGLLAIGAANAQAPAAAKEELAEVVVTGSRVITNGNDSPSPVTVVTVEDIQATRPTTVFEGLLDMPVFAASRGAAVSNPGGGGGNNNNISSLNLRGMGPTRTLVLYDGHRMPASQQNGFVDANMIPQMLLQRVDVATGGASAVYGSDAITGVVNFITDRSFNGLKVNAQTGISAYNDDRAYELGAAFGTDLFGGRGHFEGSYNLHNDAGIAHRTDRENFRPRWTVQGNGCPTGSTPANCLPYFLAANGTISTISFGGKIVGPTANPLVNQQFKTNGVLTPFQNGSSVGVAGTNNQIGGDGGYVTGSSLKAKLNFNQLYGRFDFDLTDSTHFYLSTAGALSHSSNFNNDSRILGVTMSTSNAFLSPAYRQSMAGIANGQFTFGKIWGGNNPDGASPMGSQNVDFFNRYVYFNTGLEGKFGDYKWEASLTHGDAKTDSRNNNNIDNGRLFAAMDAVVNPANSQVVCNVTLTNPGLYPGCVPINVFGPTSESQDAVNYVVRRTEYHQRNKMNDVSGSVTGSPFNDWAGPVNMALSGEWRKMTYELSSGALPPLADPLICTGLRFNCTAQNLAANPSQAGTAKWNFGSVANRPEVSQTVSEVAMEADIPLLKDMAWVRSADLNAAVRYAKYSVVGNPIITAPAITNKFSALTWKLGVDWHFNDAVTLRATRSRDFRAPNLDELYSPATITQSSGFQDTLTGSNPLAQIQGGGNPNLRPEVGYTTTAGLVLRPTPNFSLAVDFFDIRITDYMITVNGYGQPQQDACYKSGGTSYYCTLQERPTPVTSLSPITSLSNAATKWYTVLANIGESHTYGADFEANYSRQVYNHPLTLRGLLTYQPHILYKSLGVNTTDAAGTINGSGAAGGGPPGGVFRLSVFARYAVTDKLTVDWLTRWRSRLHHNADASLSVTNPVPLSPAYALSNLNLSYRFQSASVGQADLYFNVQNVFNQLPPPVSFSGASAEPGLFGGLALGDDPVGRYYSIGVRYRR